MGLTATAAAWFLPAVIPIALYVSWSDMSSMKIPNRAVYTLVICYAVLGLFAFPFQIYLWQWLHLIVVLVLGIILNAGGVLGAGDAKFAAAAAPMVLIEDLHMVSIILCACLLGAYVTHRIAKHSPVRKMVPEWESWKTGKRFPMGFPLSMALVFYHLLVLIYR